MILLLYIHYSDNNFRSQKHINTLIKLFQLSNFLKTNIMIQVIPVLYYKKCIGGGRLRGRGREELVVRG